MELFNIENPYYEKWKPGRPSNMARYTRKQYWEWEQSAPARKKAERIRRECEKSINERQTIIPHCIDENE